MTFGRCIAGCAVLIPRSVSGKGPSRRKSGGIGKRCEAIGFQSCPVGPTRSKPGTSMQRLRLNTLDRPAMPAEFVPADYFRRLGCHELLRYGRPLEVDLGCGDGSFLLDLAGAHP